MVRFNLYHHECSNHFNRSTKNWYDLDLIKEIVMLNPKKNRSTTTLLAAKSIQMNAQGMMLLFGRYKNIEQRSHKYIYIFFFQFALSTETNEIFT